MMRATAWRLLGDADAVDDALQEAYLKAHRSISRFRADSRFSTWLHRIVVNTCVDHLRRQANRFEVSIETHPEIFFVGLQQGPAAEEPLALGMKFKNLGPKLTDFHDTAGVIAHLDLVITVDTAVAHLAGAMGKAVWILLQHVGDWRWLLNRNDSPYYPSARLFRQSEPGDWPSVVSQITPRLADWASRR
jgi:RNA polymerase sigma factor (sigma-70 family)